MKYEEVIKFAFSWIYSKETWRYALILFGICVLLTVLLVAFLFLFGAMFFPALASGNPLSIASAAVGMMATAILGVFAVAIIATVAFTYFDGLIYQFGLREKALSTSGFGIGKAIMLIFLNIGTSFAAFFSVFNLKFLPILGAVIFGFLMLFFTPYPLNIFGGLIFAFSSLAYFVVILYNSYRLVLSQTIFLSKEIGIVDAIKESWQITHGKVLEIFLALFIVGIILTVIFYILSTIMQVLGYLMVLPFMFGIRSTGADAASAIIPFFLIFVIIFGILMLAMMLLSYLVSAFAVVSVYGQIIGTKPEKKPKQKVTPVPAPDKPWLAKTSS